MPNDDPNALLKRSPKQYEAYQILKIHPHGTTENVLNLSGVETATLKALEKKGLVECCLEPHDFSPTPVQLAQVPLTANEDQKERSNKSSKSSIITKHFY